MNKNLVIGGGVVLLLILVFGIFFFTRGNKKDDLMAQKNKLQEAIILTGKKLNKEKETLDTLTKGLQTSFPLAVSVQDQMKKSGDIVRQTDFMFNNPYGLNPELIIKNLKNGSSINNERRNINLLLLEWQKKIARLSAEEIDVNESEKIKQEIKLIESYINNLSEVVKILTPENSGLSQAQIDTYSFQFPSINTVNEVLVSIETAIENFNNQTSSNPSSDTPPVTTNDVVVQQVVVSQTQTEVVNLQEQLAQIEEQIQQLSPVVTPTIPPITPTSTDITTDPNTGQDVSSENNTNNVNIYAPREIIPNQGIMVQPGPPRLIQGTDPY